MMKAPPFIKPELTVRTRRPPKPSPGCVLYYFQICINDTAPLHYRVFPYPFQEIIFPITGNLRLNGDLRRAGEPFLCPILQKPKRVEFPAESVVFGIRLSPFLAPTLYAIHPTDFEKNINDLRDILTPGLQSELKASVEEAATFEERVQAANSCLLRHEETLDGSRHKLFHYILDRVHKQPGLQVEELSREVGYSTRWLQQLFRNQLNLSPKSYFRIVRFNAVISNMQQHPGHTLTRLAMDSGYYDQPHLIRDFRQLGGVSPGMLAGDIPLLVKARNHI